MDDEPLETAALRVEIELLKQLLHREGYEFCFDCEKVIPPEGSDLPHVQVYYSADGDPYCEECFFA